MEVERFWETFSIHASEWVNLFRTGKSRIVFDEINELAESCSIEFQFDLTASDGELFLIFSPEGDLGDARCIDELVSQAPLIAGWRIFNRRQRKPIQDVRAILLNLYDIDVNQLRFSVKPDAKELVVRMPNDIDIDEEETAGFCNTLLWHAIGEDCVMTCGIRCVAVPEAENALMTFLEAVSRIVGENEQKLS